MHFSAQGHFFLLLFLYFSLLLFCSLFWSPVIIYKLCLSLLPLNYHQEAWGKCRIPGPSPDLLLQNLLHPKTLGLCVHIKIRLKRISFALTLLGCLNQVELFRCLPNTKWSSLVFQRQIIEGPTSQARFKSNQVNVCKVLITVPYVWVLDKHLLKKWKRLCFSVCLALLWRSIPFGPPDYKFLIHHCWFCFPVPLLHLTNQK